MVLVKQYNWLDQNDFSNKVQSSASSFYTYFFFTKRHPLRLFFYSHNLVIIKRLTGSYSLQRPSLISARINRKKFANTNIIGECRKNNLNIYLMGIWRMEICTNNNLPCSKSKCLITKMKQIKIERT